ncbi:hypothetical protein [Bradyrhizobium sp. McL0616]
MGGKVEVEPPGIVIAEQIDAGEMRDESWDLGCTRATTIVPSI